jgi:3-oxoacyl-[acyl-carrier protein] reductase
VLSEKVIWITGATSGIGLATAQVCSRLGAIVLLSGRNEVKLDVIAEQLGENVIPMCYDVTSEEDVKAAFAHIRRHIGRVDGLVNNAGSMHMGLSAMTRLSDLQQQFNVNTVSAFQHMQLAARLMMKQGQGSIVNLCSIIGEHGAPGQAAYAASKAALSGMTKSLAKEYAAHNIRVNGVAPGFIGTEMTASLSGEHREAVLSNIALGRAGEAQEVADLISFLLSEHAAYITGQIIGIDGGMSL